MQPSYIAKKGPDLKPNAFVKPAPVTKPPTPPPNAKPPADVSRFNKPADPAPKPTFNKPFELKPVAKPAEAKPEAPKPTRPESVKLGPPPPRPDSVRLGKPDPRVVPKVATTKVTIEYPNGDAYEGLSANDKKHGSSGSYVFASGDSYTGEWEDGFAHGSGTMSFVKPGHPDPHEDLWARGACLRLVPSVSFQLSGRDDEKQPKKSSVNNMLDDWKQVIGTNDSPQSGIYTVEYLCERLLNEGDSKYWLSWLYFCSKWEQAVYGSTSMFLAFPDLTRGGFMSLTQVLISSGLLEKLLMKYVCVMPSSSSTSSVSSYHHGSNLNIQPSSAPTTPTSSSTPVTPGSGEAHYDSEVQKLFALCLDLGEEETAIQQAIRILKSTRDFARPLLTAIPPFFSHSLAQSLSVFKKPISAPLHFLNQKITSLELKILAQLSITPPVPAASSATKNAPPRLSVPPRQSVSTAPPAALPSLLRLLLQFYRERTQFAVFEHLEIAPRVIEKVLSMCGVLQGFMERKIAALEREDAIFAENLDELRSMGHLKENEQNESNSDKYLLMYVSDKSAIFKSLAEDHKRDVQVMEFVKKSCEELYKSLYFKNVETSLGLFINIKTILDKLVTPTTEKETLELCAVIADVVSQQLSELHRVVHFYAAFTPEILEKVDTHIKDYSILSQKIEDILRPPTTPATPAAPTYFSMALSFTKGILRNVTQYTLGEGGASGKFNVEEHTYKPITINSLKGDPVLLAALLRDHTDSEVVAKLTASVLVHMCPVPTSFSKDLVASGIMYLCSQESPCDELRTACLNMLQSHYSQDDEHRREFAVNFTNVLSVTLDACIKDLVPQVGTALCNLMAALTSGDSDEVKAAIVKLGIKKIIDLMDLGARHPTGETVVHTAAQVLSNIASKEEYLVEISAKGGLMRVIEVAKLGKIKAHVHIPENQIRLGETIGSGTFAEVKKGVWQDRPVAVKIFREAAFTFRLEDFWKEVAIMSLIKHDNILRLLGASIAPRKENSTFMLVTELMQKGTLRDIIRTVGPLPPPVIIKYALDIAHGMAYMHALDMLHRDIKASNILVDDRDVAKVGDLGLSRVSNSLSMTQLTGTPKWEAPECLVSSVYSKPADVYSYGVVLSEMVTGEEPFPEINDMAELKKVVCEQKLRPKLPPKAPNCPEFLSSLIKACWTHDPKKRPTFEQIAEKLSAPTPQ